jgi:hypothetical protein
MGGAGVVPSYGCVGCPFGGGGIIMGYGTACWTENIVVSTKQTQCMMNTKTYVEDSDDNMGEHEMG